MLWEVCRSVFFLPPCIFEQNFLNNTSFYVPIIFLDFCLACKTGSKYKLIQDFLITSKAKFQDELWTLLNFCNFSENERISWFMLNTLYSLNHELLLLLLLRELRWLSAEISLGSGRHLLSSSQEQTSPRECGQTRAWISWMRPVHFQNLTNYN